MTIAESHYPEVPLHELREYLRNHRDGFESRLRRLFEPAERVGLLSLALVAHLIAQESSDVSWARTASQDWAITLLLGFAGLLWQLRNTDNISKLTTELRLESFLTKCGEMVYLLALPIVTVGSIIVLGVVYFPWGLSGVLPLGAAFWYTRKTLRDVHVDLTRIDD